MSLGAGGRSVVIGTSMSFSIFQPQSVGIRMLEDSVAHSTVNENEIWRAI